MQHSRILSTLLLSIFVSNIHILQGETKQEWSFLTYIQADNNLAPFANINVRDMQKVGSTSDVNILVQWDKPSDQVTYRYKILQNNMVVNSSIGQEMGFNPQKELVDSMKWAKKAFPAKRYALILWNHGNGILDRNKKQSVTSWFQLPGLSSSYWNDKGILYDYSQNTFLDNKGLSRACSQIKTSLGKNIDILGADACLMALIEIAYQVKESVDYLVASQHTEPGLGWPYADVLSPLVGIPSMSSADTASAIVQAYGAFYNTDTYLDSSVTMSAIDVSKIKTATTTFNNVLKTIQEALLIDKATTQAAINEARANTTSFYIDDYVDLIDLYDKLSDSFDALSQMGNRKLKKTRRERMAAIATAVVEKIALAKTAALASIVSNKTGVDFDGKAYGVSIYFPANGIVDSSYKKTAFAQDTNWVTVLNSLSA
ncbi:hypothetical protein FJ364_01050 [Candidatus Dependentiae bacterium]|nr:hypothetical protein [Candidatus Dependentiae bacterium]